MSGISYKDAGVDIDAGHRAVELMKAAVERTHGPRVLGGLGSFGGLFDASGLKEMKQPVLVSSTDGVGTKTRVAAAVGRFEGVGQDIVNHCVDDILVQGAEPLFFFDYVASSRLDPEMVAAVVGGASRACEAAGCALLGGETAEMPGVYTEGEFDLVGTIVGVVERGELITGEHIQPGDQVVALPSVGLHTNGFSLARKVFEGEDLAAPVAALGGQSLADALLVPHRSYLEEFRALKAAGVAIRGMVHITGGGLIENPPRVLPSDAAFRLRRDAWVFPPIFSHIQTKGGISDQEMLRVFNCGIGLLVVVPESDRVRTLELLRGAGGFEVGEIIGRTEGGAPVQFVA